MLLLLTVASWSPLVENTSDQDNSARMEQMLEDQRLDRLRENQQIEQERLDRQRQNDE